MASETDPEMEGSLEDEFLFDSTEKTKPNTVLDTATIADTPMTLQTPLITTPMTQTAVSMTKAQKSKFVRNTNAELSWMDPQAADVKAQWGLPEDAIKMTEQIAENVVEKLRIALGIPPANDY